MGYDFLTLFSVILGACLVSLPSLRGGFLADLKTSFFLVTKVPGPRWTSAAPDLLLPFSRTVQRTVGAGSWSDVPRAGLALGPSAEWLQRQSCKDALRKREFTDLPDSTLT